MIQRYRRDIPDISHFLHKPPGNASAANETQIKGRIPDSPQRGRRNARRTRQVYDLTKGLQIIKFSVPVIPDGKNSNPVFLNILHLLTVMVLNDHFVYTSKAADIGDSLFKRINHTVFAPMIGILLRSHPDNEIISQRFCPLQQSFMAFMEQVEDTIGNDFFHFPNNSLR